MKLYDTNEYRATKQWPYAIRAGCIVFRKNGDSAEVLLLKRDPDNQLTEQNVLTYHLPKGHVGFNETLLQAAQRETKEETGCEVNICGYLGALNKEYRYKGNFYSRTFHFFVAKFVAQEGSGDDEHDGSLWCSIEEAIKLLGQPNPKGEDEIVRRLKQYLELTRAT